MGVFISRRSRQQHRSDSSSNGDIPMRRGMTLREPRKQLSTRPQSTTQSTHHTVPGLKRGLAGLERAKLEHDLRRAERNRDRFEDAPTVLKGKQLAA